jgi:hypothetical protein
LNGAYNTQESNEYELIVGKGSVEGLRSGVVRIRDVFRLLKILGTIHLAFAAGVRHGNYQ